MNDDQMRELFREMRDEPIPADSLARVRMKVSERTAAGLPSGFSFWRLSWVLGLAAIFISGVVWWNRPPLNTLSKEPAPKVAAAKPDDPPKLASRASTDPPRPRPARVRRIAPMAKPERQGAVAIRIETPDPDVVIIFLGEDGPGI